MLRKDLPVGVTPNDERTARQQVPKINHPPKVEYSWNFQAEVLELIMVGIKIEVVNINVKF